MSYPHPNDQWMKKARLMIRQQLDEERLAYALLELHTQSFEMGMEAAKESACDLIAQCIDRDATLKKIIEAIKEL